jgi:hypothetical protein
MEAPGIDLGSITGASRFFVEERKDGEERTKKYRKERRM